MTARSHASLGLLFDAFAFEGLLLLEPEPGVGPAPRVRPDVDNSLLDALTGIQRVFWFIWAVDNTNMPIDLKAHLLARLLTDCNVLAASIGHLRITQHKLLHGIETLRAHLQLKLQSCWQGIISYIITVYFYCLMPFRFVYIC